MLIQNLACEIFHGIHSLPGVRKKKKIKIPLIYCIYKNDVGSHDNIQLNFQYKTVLTITYFISYVVVSIYNNRVDDYVDLHFTPIDILCKAAINIIKINAINYGGTACNRKLE